MAGIRTTQNVPTPRWLAPIAGAALALTLTSPVAQATPIYDIEAVFYFGPGYPDDPYYQVPEVLNNYGAVAGQDPSWPSVWYWDEGWQDLGWWDRGWVNHLSDGGHVIGQEYYGDAIVMWDGTEIISLPIGASAVATNGDVISTDDNNIAAVWQYATQQIVPLGTLGGAKSTGLGMNDSGAYVGQSQIADGTYHAFLYQIRGGMEDLNDRLPPDTPWVLTEARDINEHGQIVGWGTLNGPTRAYLLDGDQVTNLGPGFGGDEYRMTINNRGEVLFRTNFGWSGRLFRDGSLHDVSDLMPPDTDWELFRIADLNDLGDVLIEGRRLGEHNSYPLLLRPDDGPVIVVSPTSFDVPEGQTADVEVSLGQDPGGLITLTTSHAEGDADLSITAGAELTFDSTNWSVAQIVTIAAAQDDDILDGEAVFEITGPGLRTGELTATEVDDDSGTGIVGDLNGDACVDQSDVGILLAAYNIDDGGDLDGDGDTDQADLGILLSHYGEGC